MVSDKMVLLFCMLTMKTYLVKGKTQWQMKRKRTDKTIKMEKRQQYQAKGISKILWGQDLEDMAEYITRLLSHNKGRNPKLLIIWQRKEVLQLSKKENYSK